MEQETRSQPGGGKRRKLWRRLGIASLIGGLVASVGATAYAHGGGFGGPWGHRGGWHAGPGQMDPEAVKRRVDAGVKWMLADINASAEQEARVAEIVAAAMKELAPMRDQHREARQAVMAELAKPTIDRAALEAIRAREIQLADQVSKRMTQSLVEAAEVLTPDQRAQLAEKMKSRMETRRGRRGEPRS